MEMIRGFASNQTKYHYNRKHSSKVTEFLAVPPSMSHLHGFYLNPVFKMMIHNTTNMLQKKELKLHVSPEVLHRINSPFSNVGS